jgi:hypothetical protein
MQVAQRGTVVNAGNEYAGPDRMRFRKNDGAFTISQSTDVPTGQGFGYSWKADVTSVAGASGNFYTFLQQRFEGQNFQSLKKGTSVAESFTLQFWIKSTVTGTYVVEIYDNDNNRSISQSYTVNSANTWEHKILTFPGDATGALDNDNNDSLEINCWLFAGSGYSSGTLNTSWNTQNDANRAVGQVNAANNTSNEIYFTGFQLEVGETATPFEHRSYGDELAKCQRYFFVYTAGRFVVTSNGTSIIAGNIFYPVTMNKNPTITYYGGNSTTGNVIFYSAGSGSQLNYTATANNLSTSQNSTSLLGFNSNNISIPNGYSAWVDLGTSANQLKITGDAEL